MSAAGQRLHYRWAVAVLPLGSGCVTAGQRPTTDLGAEKWNEFFVPFIYLIISDLSLAVVCLIFVEFEGGFMAEIECLFGFPVAGLILAWYFEFGNLSTQIC